MSHPSSQTKKKVRVGGGAKANTKTRVDAGAVVATNAQNSPIYQANADVKQAAINLIAVNGNLDAKDTSVQALEIELGAERGALANLTVDWDALWDVYVSTARIYCKTDEDAKALGLPAVGLMSHVLAMPLEVLVRWDPKNALIRIRVKRAPGLEAVRLEISPDPITATSWKELDGNGATAVLSGYAPGTWWVRAASVRARERSEFTTPVSVIVK